MRGATLCTEEVPCLYLLMSRTLQDLLLQLHFLLRYLSHFQIYLKEKEMHLKGDCYDEKPDPTGNNLPKDNWPKVTSKQFTQKE